ncbi:MAG: gliding motility protein GldM [Flavobacteriales bacterium]|nr:gliding motility protein GldM [Flavobacteriales bacterium]MCB9448970.1 gliding motility protein GldM [Flavobacteriales bacterium]
MAEKKLSPRQKMIGMMYLVLTALLALNVAKEVLDAFVLVDKSLGKTTENFQEKNAALYAEFDRQASMMARAKPFRDKAYEVKQQADELHAFIEALKKEIVAKADGPTYKMDDIQSKDNLDIPSQVMIFEKKGETLRQRMDAFRAFAFSMIPPDHEALLRAVKENLATPDPEPDPNKGSMTWEQEHFEDLPLVAVVTMLSKIQNDVRNVEFDVINDLKQNISGEDIPFNKVAGTVITPSNYVLRGDSFRADIFLAAFDTTQSPRIFLGDYETDASGNYRMLPGYDSVPVDGGIGRFTAAAHALGQQAYKGLIELQTKDGKRMFPFSGSYNVAAPQAVVSVDAMNVFYIGLDNPVSISVPGVPADKIRPQLNGNGQLKRVGDGKYEVKMNRGATTARVTVMAEMPDGQMRNMGSMDYRVKAVPNPIARVTGISTGKVRKSNLLAYPGVAAEMDDFIYAGVRWVVTDFDVMVPSKSVRALEVRGDYKFSGEVKTAFRSLAKDDLVVIQNIKAVGPGGERRNLNPVVLTVVN